MKFSIECPGNTEMRVIHFSEPLGEFEYGRVWLQTECGKRFASLLKCANGVQSLESVYRYSVVITHAKLLADTEILAGVSQAVRTFLAE